jgi:hypothetical protein
LDYAAPGAIASGSGTGLQYMGPAPAVTRCGPALLWRTPVCLTYFQWCVDQHSDCAAFREPGTLSSGRFGTSCFLFLKY